MNQKTYALSGIEKFKQRMQRGGNAQTKVRSTIWQFAIVTDAFLFDSLQMPGTSAGDGNAGTDKLRRSKTPNSVPKNGLND